MTTLDMHWLANEMTGIRLSAQGVKTNLRCGLKCKLPTYKVTNNLAILTSYPDLWIFSFKTTTGLIIETNEFRNFEYFANNWIDRSIKPTKNFIDFTWNKISCHKLTSCKFDFTFSYFTEKVFRIKKNRSKNQVKQWMIFVLQINNFFLNWSKNATSGKIIGKIMSCNNTKNNKWKNAMVAAGDNFDL